MGRHLLRRPVRKIYPGYLKRDRQLLIKRLLFSFFVFTSTLLVMASAGALTYTVKRGDTIFGISQASRVSEEQLRLVNNLTDNTIREGQELIIPHDFYMVPPGDGWFGVSRKSGVPLDVLLRINRMTKESPLRAYTKLKIPVAAALQKVHVVQAGESWAILEDIYGVSAEKMRQYSGISAKQNLVEGMTIMLIPDLVETHLVQEGETLYSLSRRYGVSIDQLMQYNALNTDIIRSGQRLRIRDPLVDNSSSQNFELDNLPQEEVAEEIAPLIDPIEIKYAYFQPSRLYFSRPPTIPVQPSAHYADPQATSVESDYADASLLYANFKEDVAQLPVLSDTLKGYKIMLDPGHGGYDPGALGSVNIGGKTYYLVEDEYVYDIALRLYAILVQHGAEVDLTILAPNHTIRENSDLESFVNQKNEVYNDAKESRRPVGGRWGLRKRVEITQRFLRNHPKEKSIFMSLHADSGDVSGLVLASAKYSDATKRLAEKIISRFAVGGRILADEYLVLKDNPAHASLLVEVRTMSKSEAKYLLDPVERQADAQRLADAILDYAGELNKMSKDEREKAISMLPKDGFIRVGKPVEMASRDRVLLIRKANEMWQAGDITAAERIFVTVNYVDGLTRLGDYYYSKQDFIKALTYFKLAKDEQRVEAITLQMVQVIQQWLQE